MLDLNALLLQMISAITDTWFSLIAGLPVTIVPDDFGLNVTRLVAGFAGGVVNAFAFTKANATGIIGSIVTGTLTANYLGDVVHHYTDGWVSDGSSAFIVGLSAMAIVQYIVAAVQHRLDVRTKR